MIFRGPYPKVEIPEKSLTEYVLERALEFGPKLALIDAETGRMISYGELHRNVMRAAAGLQAKGLGRGDVLAICAPNIPDYAIAIHAAALVGAAVTTMNPLWNAEELAYQLTDSCASFVVTVPDLHEHVLEAIKAIPIKAVFLLESPDGPDSFDRLYEFGESPEIPEINSREDVVALPYSSGTTGVSKGVMLTHRNLVANLCQMSLTEHVNETDVLLGVLPLFHIYGLVVILNFGLRSGATVVLMRRFDLVHMLKTIEKYGVTFAHLVPPIILSLTKQDVVKEHDLSSIKAIMSGAAPLSPELSEVCATRLGCLVKQGYGMTETSPVATIGEGLPGRLKHGSVGQPAPNTEVRVVDVETGVELGIREEGEILIRGPQVMKGYLNRPDATADIIDNEGWLRTGDIGYADEESFFFIVDRAKELIKYKGFQVAPAELEAVLLTHHAVADAAVIRWPDDEAGEVPKAFIVLKELASEQELMDYVADRVARYKRIRRVEFIEKIPKSPSGKILRRVLVDRDKVAQAAQTNVGVA